MSKKKLSKLLALYLPYVVIGFVATNLGEAWRLAAGKELGDKIVSLMDTLPAAFSNPLPSLHPLDLLVGLCCGAAMRLAVYLKGKNAKKYRHGMDPEIATIQWEMLSNAEFSVAIPLYSALLTEVSPYFSDQDVSFDHCEEEDVVNNEEPKNSINYVLMDINTLAYENRDHCATGVRAYLDALQKELIEQNLTVDEAMQAAEGTEARTALANKAGKAATKNTYLKCKAMLEEMRDYLKEEDFSEEFVPSDYDADNDCLVESITYADEALSDEDVAEPEVEEEEATEKKSEGNNMAAMAVGAVVIIGVCGFVLYRRKKA